MTHHKAGTVWAIIIIAIALIVAILASVWPQERLSDIIYMTRFFDVMLPILAAGALVKYLAKCGQGCGCGCASCKSSCNRDKTL